MSLSLSLSLSLVLLGSPNHLTPNDTSPDDRANFELGREMATYAGTFKKEKLYPGKKAGVNSRVRMRIEQKRREANYSQNIEYQRDSFDQPYSVSKFWSSTYTLSICLAAFLSLYLSLTISFSLTLSIYLCLLPLSLSLSSPGHVITTQLLFI